MSGVSTTDNNWLHGLAEAKEVHRAGQLDVARAAYEILLTAAPEDADVRGLLGVLALQEGRLGEAEALLRQAVGAAGDARIHLRNLNNLLALLQQSSNVEAARALVAGDLPEWPEGAVPDASERQTVLSLCRALLLLDRAPAARALLERAILQPGPEQNPGLNDNAEVLGLMGQILLAVGETAPAAEALERAAQLAPDDCQPLIALSYAQGQIGQPDAARATVDRVTRRWAVHDPAPRPSQRADILVLNPTPGKVSNLYGGLHALHSATNFPTQFATSMHGEFRFLSAFADLPSGSLPQRLPQKLSQSLRKTNVILNNC